MAEVKHDDMNFFFCNDHVQAEHPTTGEVLYTIEHVRGKFELLDKRMREVLCRCSVLAAAKHYARYHFIEAQARGMF